MILKERQKRFAWSDRLFQRFGVGKSSVPLKCRSAAAQMGKQLQNCVWISKKPKMNLEIGVLKLRKSPCSSLYESSKMFCAILAPTAGTNYF